MRALALVIACGLAWACTPPGSSLEAQCEPSCLTEAAVRLNSNDVLVTAPGIWRFYDDVAAQLPRACAGDGGVLESGLTPLWRRTIVGVRPEYSAAASERASRGRSALAVHPTGGIAVSIDGALWLIEPLTGVPRHIMKESVVLPDRNVLFREPVAAFTPDGTHLWIGGTGPLLLDLERYDKRLGFHVDYSWALQNSKTFLDLWSFPSQSVGADGTLFWANQAGVIRALEPSGVVRWEQRGETGFVTLDDDDSGWWSNRTERLNANDGGVVWAPEPMPTRPRTLLLNLEGSPLADSIAVEHFTTTGGGGIIAQHRRDGSIGGTISLNGADATASRDTTLIVAKDQELSAWSSVSQQRLWSTSLGGRISAGPVLSKQTGSAWVVTDDCRVSEVDRSGVVKRWFQMAGRPADQIARISDGVLYVLSMTENRLLPGDELTPGMVMLPDGGPTRAVDYGCYADHPFLCGLGVRPGPMFFLYAFRIE